LARIDDISDYLIAPDPGAARLTRGVTGTDQNGQSIDLNVVEERPLTIFLNGQEIVTAMTIGDYPAYLALGFLRNQGMLRDGEAITGVDYDEELETVVVRTEGTTTYEDKLKKKTRTSGCAVGTVFGDMMEGLEGVVLPNVQVRTSDLYALAAHINRTPSLYLEAGPCTGVPVGLYRVGGRDRTTGWSYPHWPHEGTTVCLSGRRGASDPGCRPSASGG